MMAKPTEDMLQQQLTVVTDEHVALAMARLNRHIKSVSHQERGAFYALKQRYIKALYQHTRYVVGVYYYNGLYEFHIEIGEFGLVLHQLPQEMDYAVEIGGCVVYAPCGSQRLLTPREYQNHIAAVEAWLLDYEVQP